MPGVSTNRLATGNISRFDSLRSESSRSEGAALSDNINFVKSNCGSLPHKACSFECPNTSKAALAFFQQRTGIDISSYYSSHAADIAELKVNDGVVALAGLYALMTPEDRDSVDSAISNLFAKFSTLPLDGRVKALKKQLLAMKDKLNVGDKSSLDRLCDTYMEQFVLPEINKHVASHLNNYDCGENVDSVLSYSRTETMALLNQNLLSNFEAIRGRLTDAVVASFSGGRELLLGNDLACLFKHLDSYPVLLNSYQGTPGDLKNERGAADLSIPHAQPLPPAGPAAPGLESVNYGNNTYNNNNNNNINLDGLADVFKSLFLPLLTHLLQGVAQADRTNSPRFTPDIPPPVPPRTHSQRFMRDIPPPVPPRPSEIPIFDWGNVSGVDDLDGKVLHNNPASETEPKSRFADSGSIFRASLANVIEDASIERLTPWQIAHQISLPGSASMQQTQAVFDLLNNDFQIRAMDPTHIPKLYSGGKVPFFIFNHDKVASYLPSDTVTKYSDYWDRVSPEDSLYAGIAVIIMREAKDSLLHRDVIKDTPEQTVSAIRKKFSELLKDKEREKLNMRADHYPSFTEVSAVRSNQTGFQRYRDSSFKLDSQ